MPISTNMERADNHWPIKYKQNPYYGYTMIGGTIQSLYLYFSEQRKESTIYQFIRMI